MTRKYVFTKNRETTRLQLTMILKSFDLTEKLLKKLIKPSISKYKVDLREKWPAKQKHFNENRVELPYHRPQILSE